MTPAFVAHSDRSPRRAARSARRLFLPLSAVLTCCYTNQSGWGTGWGRGCRRRPKTKYASGAPPKELTTATTAAHIHFESRIWLAGRRLMSMSAAVLRMPSATAAAMISLRLRVLRSLHFRVVPHPLSPAAPTGTARRCLRRCARRRSRGGRREASHRGGGPAGPIQAAPARGR